MLKRIKRFQDYINRLIANSSSINGIMAAQATNLELRKLDSYEWRLIESLVKVLEKFYTVTVIVSGSRYPTLSKSYWCSKILLKFLKTQDSTESSFDQKVKSLFLPLATKHLDTKISKDQKKLTLIAAFLDLGCFKHLSSNEREKAWSLLKNRNIDLINMNDDNNSVQINDIVMKIVLVMILSLILQKNVV